MTRGILMVRILLAVAAMAILQACASSPPSRFYTLNPMAPTEEGAKTTNGAKPVSITVMPVELPDYLDRPQIVTRYGRNQLKMASFDRWAGSLGDNMSAVLAENLSTILQTDQVSVQAGQGKADYAVAMRVVRLDCIPGDQVRLKAHWNVFSGPGQKNVVTGLSNIRETLTDMGYDSIVAAVSKAMGLVSRDIARKIAPQ